MKTILGLSVLFTCFFMICCETINRNTFQISIEYSSVVSLPVKYLLTDNAITVLGKRYKSGKWVSDDYSRDLTLRESDSIYHFLSNLKTDTLKNSYEDDGFSDGMTMVLQVRGRNIKPKRVLVYMTSTAITDTLEALVQNTVLDKKFKWPNYYRH